MIPDPSLIVGHWSLVVRNRESRQPRLMDSREDSACGFRNVQQTLDSIEPEALVQTAWITTGSDRCYSWLKIMILDVLHRIANHRHGKRDEPDASIRKHSVNVEENEFNFAGASGSG